MSKTKSSKSIGTEIVDFFASVKLALVLLITLAVTSILGTVLPQGEPLVFYEQSYPPLAGSVIRIFHLYDMYHSWWFQWLLILLTVNLLVCSLKRFSSTWKVIKASPRPVSDHLFTTLPFSRKFSSKDQFIDSRVWIKSLLGRHFGKPISLFSARGSAFYLEKSRFSRFGVYLIHLSVLIIFAGAIIGSLYGFEGFLELKEGESKDQIFIKGPPALKKLGFFVRLDSFTMAFYPNGMPREYRSDLSIRENGQEKEKASVRVNDPFSYKGITFYQASWDQFPISIRLSLNNGGKESVLWLKMGEKVAVPGTSYALQTVRYDNNLAEMGPALGLILFQDQKKVDQGWILANHSEFHGNRLGEFHIRVKEIKTQYVSGLQVNQDPGVWFIWIGCSLMFIGFIIAFYFSHQQVWIWIREKEDPKGEDKTEILIGGTAHKNQWAFVRKMEQLTNKVQVN